VRLFRDVLAFLRAMSEVRPMVLLPEDVHWADATCLALLLFLGRHVQESRILLLGTYRDVEVGRHHPLEATLREFVRDRLVHDVSLHRLSRSETEALVRLRLGVRSTPSELVEVIHERAQGNPLFIEELVSGFVASGALVVDNQGVQLTREELVELPRSIRSSIEGRIDRLPIDRQEV
jgi:predicted ATPase